MAGLAGRAPATRGTYRSALYRLAVAAHGPPGQRPTPFPGARAPAPYSPAERAELAALAAAQRDPARRSSALALVVFGIGAGLRPGELVALRGDDVIRHGRQVVVHAGGPAARLVPVTPDYAGRARELARRAGSGFVFRPGPADRGYKNFVSNFTRGLTADPAAPRLSLRRARATFICVHPRDGLVHPARGNLGAEQHADELRGPLRRHVPVARQQNGGRVQDRPVAHRTRVQARRRFRERHRAAAAARQARQQVLRHLPEDLDVDDLRPARLHGLWAGLGACSRTGIPQADPRSANRPGPGPLSGLSPGDRAARPVSGPCSAPARTAAWPCGPPSPQSALSSSASRNRCCPSPGAAQAPRAAAPACGAARARPPAQPAGPRSPQPSPPPRPSAARWQREAPQRHRARARGAAAAGCPHPPPPRKQTNAETSEPQPG